MDDEDGIEIIEHGTAYQGYFRIDRYRLRHRVFEAGWSPEMTREVFERGHAVVVLPYDPVLDRVVMIEQFRIGAFTAPDFSPFQTEVVAGMVDSGQTAEEAARRETKEETGLEAQDLFFVNRFLVSPGGTSESLHFYCARVDSAGAGGVHGDEGEHEFMRVFTASATEAFAMLEDGRITNAVTIIALQWLKLNHASLRDKWRAA